MPTADARPNLAAVFMLAERMLTGWLRVAARPATGGSDGHGWGATAPGLDGDVVRYGVGG